MMISSMHFVVLFNVVTLIVRFSQALPVDWSLVAYFPFDGNAEDQTGLGNLSPMVVNAQLTVDRFGGTKKAYLFDGSSSYIYYSAGNSRFGFGVSFSVSFWIQPTSPGTIFDSGFLFNQGFHVSYRSGGFIDFSFAAVGDTIQKASAPVLASEWNHIVISKSSLNVMIYVNNDLVLTQNITYNVKSQVPLPFVIGGQPTTNTIPPTVPSSSIFGGKIDDSCFYWSQLSALEVSLLFNYPYAPSVPTRSPTKMPSKTPTLSPSLAPTFAVTARPTLTSLVAYYPFDGNANDSSGNQIHGTPYNTNPTTDRFGNPNGAYYFNGWSSYITFPIGNFMFTSEMSVSFWIKASPYYGWSGILDLTHYHSGDGFLAGWYVFLSWGYTIVYDFVNPNTGRPDFPEETTVPFPVDSWAHIAIAKTPSLIKYYINGVKTREIPCSSTILMRNDIPLVIGAANVAAKDTITPFYQTLFYTGSLDDVSIYSRELKLSEVTALYTGSMSPTIMPTFSFAPSRSPSCVPTETPTVIPSLIPTPMPSTAVPSVSSSPSFLPSVAPSLLVTAQPTFSDLVAHYTFDGHARDSSRNQIHGTPNNIIADRDRFGNANGALRFNGYNSYVIFSVGNFMFTTTMSVSFWMKVNSISHWTGVLDLTHYFNEGGFIAGWYVFLDRDDSITYGFVNPTTVFKDFPESNSAPITLNQWMHIAITKSVSSVKIYVNGILKKEIPCSSTIATRSDMPLVIGSANQAIRSYPGRFIQNDFFDGSLDDVYIYSRELTPTEIRTLYNYGSSSPSFLPSVAPSLLVTVQPTFSDLVAHYTFDGHARDSSRNQIHGTPNNIIADRDRFGNANGALRFDGYSSYVIFPVGNFMFTTTMSVSFWMKVNSISQWTGVLDLTHYYYNVGFIAGWYVFLNSDASITYDFVNPTTVFKDFPESNSAPIVLNDWMHIAITKSVSSVKIYVNGILKKEIPCSSTIATRSDMPLVIGAANLAIQNNPGRFSRNNFFNGLLDDLYIYSRELTPTEIQRLYNYVSSSPSFLPSLAPSFSNPRPTISDLVAHYTFDGHVEDSSRNRIHGSTRGVLPDADRFGNAHGALRFNGYNSYVIFPVGNFMFTTTMSVSFWMKVAFLAQWTGVLDLTHYFNEGGFVAGWYVFLNSDHSITYGFVNPSTGSKDFPESNSAPITLNQWMHIAITKSVSSVKIYVNGILKKEIPCSSTIATRSDMPLVIGAANLAIQNNPGKFIQNNYFFGSLDDLYIYSRELTPTEIHKLSSNSGSSSSSSSRSVPSYVWVIIVVVVVLVGGCMCSRSWLRSMYISLFGHGPTPSSSRNTVHVYENASAPVYVETIEMGRLSSSLPEQQEQYPQSQQSYSSQSKQGYEPIAVAIQVDGSSSAVFAMATVEDF